MTIRRLLVGAMPDRDGDTTDATHFLVALTDEAHGSIARARAALASLADDKAVSVRLAFDDHAVLMAADPHVLAEVLCSLPGGPPADVGDAVSVGPVSYDPLDGEALFHLLRGPCVGREIECETVTASVGRGGVVLLALDGLDHTISALLPWECLKVTS
jgi:hypothetical protein